MPTASIPSVRNHYDHPPQTAQYQRMQPHDLLGTRPGQKMPFKVIASYVFDWAILVVFGVVGYILGTISPNKRPFQLENPGISFPFPGAETVDTVRVSTLVIIGALAPVIIIAVIALVFIPGPTVPRGASRAQIWRLKLWEVHAGWLGLGLSVVVAFFISNCIKNLFGKPRPNLLGRCQPDIANLAKFVVGGYANASSNGQLVSAGICLNPDKAVIDEGFRSLPSGHATFAAAGLIYLSLFIASKFAITIPFLVPAAYGDDAALAAFPHDRAAAGSDGYELPTLNSRKMYSHGPGAHDATPQQMQTRANAAARAQAAAPPIYLLVAALTPFCASLYVAASRWYDFQHDGFDIFWGFLIGAVCAVCSFRYYHMPLTGGAGWAWGPRSSDKAFWAGVGSFSYATDHWGRNIGGPVGVGGGGAVDEEWGPVGNGHHHRGGVGGGYGQSGSVDEGTMNASGHAYHGASPPRVRRDRQDGNMMDTAYHGGRAS